jgi:hypothetical protein
MDKEVLFDTLDGFFAYDTGCVDSGIHDTRLKTKIKLYLHELPSNDFRLLMTEFIREYFVSEEAVSKGYGIEDVKSFINWLDEEMGL